MNRFATKVAQMLNGWKDKYTLLEEEKGFFGCRTFGTFKGSLNGSKWVFRTIFRTFLGSLELFFVIYGTFLGSWTCKKKKKNFGEPFFPRVLNTGQKDSKLHFFLRV